MIDGWLVRASLGGVHAYWLVKGYEHPDEGVIAVPYRLVGPPRRLGLGEALRLACGLGLCVSVDCVPRQAPLIPRRAAEPVDPVRALALRTRDLPPQARELIDRLGVEAGLTGSWAVYAEGPDSDVDILVWDDVYEALEDLAADGFIDHSCEGLSRRDRARAVERGAWRRGLLDACYRGVPYTIRILTQRDPIPCRCRRTPLGVWEGVVKLDPITPHTTPARYAARASDGSTFIMETWRTRFMELVPGRYAVRGDLVLDECEGFVVSPDLGGRIEPAWRDTGGS